ncbi:hypothetical protein C5O27_08245 [Gordonia alkanivorans]|uniref:hypothetical protein n=1 Tax=Gordonia alkanivorans TaxID=84096 RepID=UPI000FDDDC4B|nr:hypothetical protein [Gordonia alkanivorans]AZZ81051.1 hypothetical protein C5O27_08245 [Gordonia alkanivorans]
MPPSYNEVTSWKPSNLVSIANGIFALKASLDLEAPLAGNPVLDLTPAEWTGEARGPADSRAESVTRWLRNVADEYGDLASVATSGAANIESAVTTLKNATEAAGDQGYILDRGSREYTVTFDPNTAPSGAEYSADLAFQHQSALRAHGTAADQAVTDTKNAIESALSEIGGITPASIATASGTMTRTTNQAKAFEQVYGYMPATANDWRIAAALDPHSYDPKNKGVPPAISVIKIRPVPGQGVVATGLFIPIDEVIAGMKADKPLPLPRNLGDNREFDVNFAPEDTRVSYFIDYENGVIVARQNPSVDEHGNVKTGTPSVKASQLADGTVAIAYEGSDPLAPEIAADLGWSVNGQTIVTPEAGGARVSGEATDYPSMETYQHLPDGRTEVLHRDDAGDHDKTGPMLNLKFHHDYGDYDNDLDRFPTEKYTSPGNHSYPIDLGNITGMTDLGSADDPPELEGAR